MSARPDVSILVVSYRNPELTRDCLNSVIEQTAGIEYELIVVDNASPDGTAEMVAREFPRARLFALEENIGFARANNLGARHATGEFLLLLNPDTVVHDGAVQRLVSFARSHQEAGIVGGRTLTSAGSLDPSSCWGVPTPWSLACFGLGLSTAFAASPLFDPESLGTWRRDTVREVGVVTGCLLLLRMELWEELGGFDPDFFMFGEDADLSIRARRLGWRPTITPAAEITHLRGASSPGDGPKLVLLLTAKATLVRKHWTRPRAGFGLTMLQLGTGLRAMGARIAAIAGRRRGQPWVHAWRERREWRMGFASARPPAAGHGNEPAPPEQSTEAPQEAGGLSTAVLTGAAVTGVRWFAAGRLVVEIVGLAAAIILAHLLTPAEFGRATIALALPMLAVILAFEGFGTLLVQRPTITRAHQQGAALLSLCFGSVLGALVYLLAPSLSNLFDPETADLIRLMSPVFPLAGASVVSMAALQRRLDFARLAVAEVGSLTIGAATSIALAITGAGAEAIVLGALAGFAVQTAILVLSARPPVPRLSVPIAQEIVGFGTASALAGLAYALRRNIAYLILGARVGPAQVGLYWRAFQVGAEYQAKLSGIVLRILFPVLSRTSDHGQLQSTRLRAQRLNSAVIFPLLGMLIVVAPEVVPFVFGSQWEQAVEPAQLLAVAGMALVLLSGTEAAVLAAGRPWALLAYSTGFLVLYGAATWLAAPHGLIAVCASAVAVHLVVLVSAQHLLLGRVLGTSPREFWLEAVPATVATVALLGAALPLAWLLRGEGAASAVVVVTASVAGTAAYLAVMRSAFPLPWAELLTAIRRILGRRAAGEPAR